MREADGDGGEGVQGVVAARQFQFEGRPVDAEVEPVGVTEKPNALTKLSAIDLGSSARSPPSMR